LKTCRSKKVHATSTPTNIETIRIKNFKALQDVELVELPHTACLSAEME